MIVKPVVVCTSMFGGSSSHTGPFPLSRLPPELMVLPDHRTPEVVIRVV